MSFSRLNETDSSILPIEDLKESGAEEMEDVYRLEFEFKSNIWYKTLVIKFKENEDLGRVDPVQVKMQNFILKESLDTYLNLIM